MKERENPSKITNGTQISGAIKATDATKVTNTTKITDSIKATDASKATNTLKITNGTQISDSIIVTDAAKMSNAVKITDATKTSGAVKVTNTIKITGGTKISDTSKVINAAQIASVIKIIRRGAVQLIYPLHCPVCDEIVPFCQEKICDGCLPKLKLLAPPWCMRCGKKLAGEAEYCADCGQGRHGFERGRSLYEYDSAARSIYRFKYGGRREYAGFYGEQAVEYLGDYIRSLRPDGLVPIPLHPRRKSKRGYNQAELFAREIGRRMYLPVYPDLLIRVKNTVPLKQLNPKERQNNLKKAFNISRNDVKLKTILLIDDIYTTGSTMDEAVRALKSGGVEKVFFLTLACGAGI